jgi:D-arabinose 5-phosphate isomerase GutQ
VKASEIYILGQNSNGIFDTTLHKIGGYIMRVEALDMAKRSFRIEAQSILETMDNMDFEALGNALDVLSKCNRIAASGCGHSGIACMHFAHSMCCIERPARFISPAEAVHGAMGFIQEGDVVVLASRGGKTSELLPILDICKEKKAVVIGITENTDSPLAIQSDIFIPMNIKMESDKYNSQGTSSFIALSAIFDAIQVALMEETQYTNEQFALIHPGGAVGERLNKSTPRNS